MIKNGRSYVNEDFKGKILERSEYDEGLELSERETYHAGLCRVATA